MTVEFGQISVESAKSLPKCSARVRTDGQVPDFGMGIEFLARGDESVLNGIAPPALSRQKSDGVDLVSTSVSNPPTIESNDGGAGWRSEVRGGIGPTVLTETIWHSRAKWWGCRLASP